ncbi:hypothetical protein L596_008955 [Steinernema carpocapsae]|uniref:Uncharacterized protein n=1 Tax=Steinernema carpocapsae TaxID=34508 RepID=A0A4U5PDY8_STECR|nr:hypothetical protein L596_008955 [Steinernema carpocapsae]
MYESIIMKSAFILVLLVVVSLGNPWSPEGQDGRPGDHGPGGGRPIGPGEHFGDQDHSGIHDSGRGNPWSPEGQGLGRPKGPGYQGKDKDKGHGKEDDDDNSIWYWIIIWLEPLFGSGENGSTAFPAPSGQSQTFSPIDSIGGLSPVTEPGPSEEPIVTVATGEPIEASIPVITGEPITAQPLPSQTI